MGTVSGPASSVVGHTVLWNNTAGTLVSDGGVVSPDWYNVLNYGADPTGAADSTTAFTNAISAANTAGRGVIYAPAGKYKISSLAITGSNISLRGDGSHITTLVPSSTSGDFIYFNGGSYIDIRDIGIDATGVTRTSGANLHIQSSATTIDKFYCYGGYDGVSFDAAGGQVEGRILNSTIKNAANNNFSVGTHSSGVSQFWQDLHLVSVEIYNGGNANIMLQNVSGLYALNVACGASSGHGIVINPPASNYVIDCFFVNVLSDSDALDGWYITNTSTGIVGNIMLDQCWGSGSKNCGVNINGANISGVTIRGGTYLSNYYCGINLSSTSDVLIDGALLGFNSRTGSGVWAGIQIQAGVSNFQIIGCTSGAVGYPKLQGTANYQSWGVAVQPGASNNYLIQNNICPGNVGGPVTDGGSGTNKFVGGSSGAGANIA